jgi:UDP-glucose 4-epimerase
MQQTGVDKLVFSSTCAVYGSPTTVPINEEVPKDPVNPYGASKLAAERMMDDFYAAHGINSVRLRYFNACGAAPEAGLGEDREVETHLIPLVLDAASGRRRSISVFGNDYSTPDGTAVRDYVHVSDLADAHVSALNYLGRGGGTAALNLGTGKGHSVAEVISVAEDVTGATINKEVAPRRMGDPPNLVADPTRARELLSWEAHRSDLCRIIQDAWAWHRSRFKNQRL